VGGVQATSSPSAPGSHRAPPAHRPPRSRESSLGATAASQGELLGLGHRCSHLTVRKVRRHRPLPAPRRSQRCWRHFIREHADQILATDFFTVDTVWLTRLYVLFFIELCSRRVHFAGCTPHPGGEWVVHQARNLAWKLQDGELRAKFLLRDRDDKFTAAFDDVFRSERVEVVRLPYRSPLSNAVAERWIGTVRRELLDHLLVFGQRHLERVLVEFIIHYNGARPHQGLAQRTPDHAVDPIPLAALPAGDVERRDRIGGLIHEYRRAA